MAGSYGWLLAPLPDRAKVSSVPLPSITSSAEALRTGMRSLAAAYCHPRVQSQLREQFGPRKRGCSKAEEMDQLKQLRQFLLPVQIPVLQMLGYPPTADGVASLQNAVHRRVYEGDVELKRLANESLAVLHLKPMRVYTQETTSADDVFVEMDGVLGLDRHADVSEVLVKAAFGGKARQDLQRAELYETGLILKALESVRARLQPKGPISIGILNVVSKWEQLGLPEAFHARPSTSKKISVARLHKPSSSELFRYVLKNRPVVISGCLAQEEFQPMRDFADLAYLQKRCGKRPVIVSSDLCKDTSGHAIFMAEPSIEMAFSDYLEHVRQVECSGDKSPSFYMCKMPLKSQLPELAEDVDSSPSSPFTRFGDCFGCDQKGTHMHFGCGRSSSAIHFDPSENLIAVITGTKTFELYPPYDVDGLYPSKPPAYVNSAVPPFVSPEAMPEEFKSRWPLYLNTQPVRVNLVAGDILYLPIFWWHGVTGGSSRSLVLNWWCQLHPDKIVNSSCEAQNVLSKLQGFLNNAGGAARSMGANCREIQGEDQSGIELTASSISRVRACRAVNRTMHTWKTMEAPRCRKAWAARAQRISGFQT